MLGSWLIACCKLTPTLARQMWRHNDVIGRNEYLIFTLSESTFLRYIQCNFCLNLHITHGDMKENMSGCFFSEHSVHTLWLTVKASPHKFSYLLTYWSWSWTSESWQQTCVLLLCMQIITVGSSGVEDGVGRLSGRCHHSVEGEAWHSSTVAASDVDAAEVSETA